MNFISIKNIQNQDIVNQILSVPFFEEIHKFSLKEFNTLLDHAKLIELGPGEELLTHGESNNNIYVLLEGELDVFQDESKEDKALGKIVGAQIFGALGAINHEPRTATIAASRTEMAKVLAIDFDLFGQLEDFSNISIRSKVLLYQVVVNNIRFKLKCIQQESGRYQYTTSFVDDLPSKYRKNSLAQLRVLALQTHRLGHILEMANQESEPNIELPKYPTHISLMTSVKNFFIRNHFKEAV